MTEGKTAAQKAASVGTLLAMWQSYRDNVIRTLPGHTPLHADASRLDFYSGAKSVFVVVRAIVEQGGDPEQAVRQLLTMEAECDAALR